MSEFKRYVCYTECPPEKRNQEKFIWNKTGYNKPKYSFNKACNKAFFHGTL